MPRPTNIPPCPRPPSQRSTGRVTRTYSIDVKTPLFGGGVEAGTPDETMPIRATAIRGQLQFWWRATRGARFASFRELFARHAEVWGSVGKDKARRSPIEVSVRAVSHARVRACAQWTWDARARRGSGGWRLRWDQLFHGQELPYALFPFQGTSPTSPESSPDPPPAAFIEHASFELHLRFPGDLEEDVETAVWAWVNFGGLGSRTRRGCGALLCQELAPNGIGDIARWFRDGCDGIDRSIGPRAWTTLPASILVATERALHPIEAWKQAIGLLQHFRQGKNFARNQGKPPRPGRSRYPEPETIRRVTRRRSSRHERTPQIPDNAFPRAELGLPIIFHFQDERKGEPHDTFLYPAGSSNGERLERMASPLILAPLLLRDGTAVPLILRLVTQPLSAVELRARERGTTQEPLSLPFTPVIRAPGMATYKNSPLHGCPSGSALDAFIALAGNRSYTEITR